MPVWRSSDSPASWTLLNEGAKEKRQEKIGHVSRNLCSVNFPAPASTVYRVLCISNLPLLFSPSYLSTTIPPLLPPRLPSFTNTHFSWLMLFCFSFFVSQVRMLSLGVAKFTSSPYDKYKQRSNQSNVSEWESEGKHRWWCLVVSEHIISIELYIKKTKKNL